MLRNSLRQLRSQKGVSQLDVARQLKMSQPAIASWELGRTEPSVEMIKQLARYFGVSTDYLLGNDSPPAHSPAESSLVEQYRRLSPDNKLMVERMISALAAQQQSA